jgi:hypothetical protein
VDVTSREGGFVRNEIDGQGGDLLGTAEPGHGLSSDERNARFLDGALGSEGVCTVRGQIALQRIPFRMNSAAIPFVSPMTAASVAPHTKRFGAPLTLEAADGMLMMLPFSALSMPGRKARHMRYIDLTLRSKEQVQRLRSDLVGQQCTYKG